jgi:23S rRNA (cytidine1920-2'-O)/16S rRNA (cytidine1409-2'-O)-methyltransferase
MEKIRLDNLMAEKGMVESRSLAQKLIMAGQVKVNGNLALKPSDTVSTIDEITIDFGPRYVSRGGDKLEAALHAFSQPNLAGKICADLGASTGGFTDCMLQHGAIKVYAVDVGQGILHWRLRNDPRVVVLEKCNARNLTSLPEKIDLITADLSFISSLVLLPVFHRLLDDDEGKVILLVKPQFEAGREEAARGKGVIRDPKIHRQVLEKVIIGAREEGFSILGLISSPLLGPKGNREFLLFRGVSGVGRADFDVLIHGALRSAEEKDEK